MSTFYQAVQQIRLHTSGRLTCHPRTYAILAVFISYEVKHTNTIQCQETAAKLKEKEGEKKKTWHHSALIHIIGSSTIRPDSGSPLAVRKTDFVVLQASLTYWYGKASQSSLSTCFHPLGFPCTLVWLQRTEWKYGVHQFLLNIYSSYCLVCGLYLRWKPM